MFHSLVSGEMVLRLWIYAFAAIGVIAGIASGFLKARKIQPNGFKWLIFRHEAIWAVASILFGALVLGTLNQKLRTMGVIRFNHEAASWGTIAWEYALSFVLFDTYFYWLHRWMHTEPAYTWIHKLHHKSTSPNPLTTLSVNPLESAINGGFVPLFLSIFTVHDATAALLLPTNLIMGIYVHTGFEFLPRWWNRSWLTKWFISATFHDQHHRYFTGNFGGYTTVWDRLCGTMRPKFEADFDAVKARLAKKPQGEPASKA